MGRGNNRGNKRGGRGGRSRGGNRNNGVDMRDLQQAEREAAASAAGEELPQGSGAGGGYEAADLKNPRFEAYYREQGILPDAEEFEQFLESMRTPLPTTFRITAGRPFTTTVLRTLQEEHIPHLKGIEFEGESVTPPSELPFYPRRLGWHIDVKKSVLRKQEQFKKLQGWLVHETNTGVISRQEAVSMVPPLFLNVQPHHIVLDMCAAPGSKTAQLLEALHAPLLTADGKDPVADSAAEAQEHDTEPLGLIIANDSDAKRVTLLKHQAVRIPSPNLIVTNADARFFPHITVPYLSAADKAKAEASNGEVKVRVENRELRYDRILADVPCSGDGTLRKNLMIWQKWTHADGNGLHK